MSTSLSPSVATALAAARSALSPDTPVEDDVRTALSDLARALGAKRSEKGTITALRAIVEQQIRPGPATDKMCYQRTGASKSNFMKWKRRVHECQVAGHVDDVMVEGMTDSAALNVLMQTVLPPSEEESWLDGLHGRVTRSATRSRSVTRSPSRECGDG